MTVHACSQPDTGDRVPGTSPAPSSILLVRLSALGDCIHAVPVAWALRRAFPAAHIGWAIQPGPHSLLAELPCVDEFHLVPRRASWSQRLAALRAVRRRRYEVVVDLQGLAKSALVTLVSGARRRLGWAGRESREGNRFVLTERLEVPPEIPHVVDRNLALLALLGVDRPEVQFELPIAAAADEAVMAHLAAAGLADRGFVVVWPGTTWDTKIWPVEKFEALCRGLIGRGRQVVVGWGTPSEGGIARRIAAASGATVGPSTTLPELSALLARAALVVAGDTGPLHLAVAHGIPTVGIFGATDPARSGPWDDGSGRSRVVVRAGLDCRPCGQRTCGRGDLACLVDLDVAAVFAACEDQLSRF